MKIFEKNIKKINGSGLYYFSRGRKRVFPHFPITQEGLVKFGWKKNLKIYHPVDVSFTSENYGKNDFCVVKCVNASFTKEPKDDVDKKVINNDGDKVNNIILVQKVPIESKLKEEKKTYKFCDNFPLHGIEVEYSFEGDNYETDKGVNIVKKQKEMIKKKSMKNMKI